MKNDEKFDFIKEKLNENTEEMPLSLSRENIVSSLENIGAGTKIKRLPAKKGLAIAASVAIVILSILTVGYIKMPALSEKSASEITTEGVNNSDTPATSDTCTTTTMTAAENDENVSDYSDIIEYFKSMYEIIKEPEVTTAIEEGIDKNYAMGYEVPDMMASNAENSSESFTFKGEGSTGSAVSYGQTNTQVNGIDEGDIVKNDGTYLYILRNSKRIDIYRASDLTLMSEIVLPDIEGKSRSDANEIYLSSERLVILSTVREAADKESEGEGDVIAFGYYMTPYFQIGKTETECLVYDINNREAPKLIFTNTQSGNYNTSRLIGDTLYTVTRYTAINPAGKPVGDSGSSETASDENYIKNCIPKLNGKSISRSSIDFFKDSGAMGYVVVSSCNITKDKPEGIGYAYLGNADDVYCTKDTLYLSNVVYTDDMSEKDAKNIKKEFDLDNGWHTHIYAVSLSESSIKSKGNGYVRGEFINQFSMDEYNGYFRCATTYRDKDWNAVSSVIILNKDFKEVSRIDGLAENEEIKSVRFMGDIAYVVTFRNTDPLFVLDLSDPTSPKKDGEVKLPGFSAYLHPIGNDFIVGVGHGGTSTGTDGSVQVTLFDVKDKKSPKVSSSYKIKNVYTEVNESEYDNNSFKAFLYYPERNIIGIPVEKWNNDELIREYVLFKTENGKLELINQYRHENVEYEYDDDEVVIFNTDNETQLKDEVEENEYFPEFFRGTYIDNTLYTLSDNRICAFDIESANKLCEVEFKK